VRSFTGATFTDDHLNIVLYRIDNGNRVMINYAYAHTNAQELSAKVIPGTYELRVNGAQNVNKFIPFIVKIEFYKTAEWAWAEVMGSSVKISIPIFAQAGTYAAYLVRTLGGTTSLVPVMVTVPITVGKLVRGSVDVSHDSSSIMTGDWIYYAVDIPEGSNAVTAVLAWANQDTDIDLYLINPEGDPVALSLTPTASGLFAPWRTSTGTTAQVVSEPNPEAGRWMIGLHDTFLGKVFEAPYLLSVSLESPIMFGEDSVSVDGTGQATIANSLLLPISVKLIPVTTDLSTATKDRVGTLKSIDIGGAGFSEQLIMVDPGTASIKFSISWAVPEADVSVVVYAADGSNRGILRSQGAELTVENPDPGVWDVVVMLDDVGQETGFTLSTTTVSYTHWEDLSITPNVVMLGPLDGTTVELTAASSPTVTSGMIVMYDLVTGSVYDTLPVTLVSP
jgi:hypothetical protein